MRTQTLLVIAALGWLSAAPAQAQVAGYLGPFGAPRMVEVLPAPPAPGTGADADDRKAFRDTRGLKGQPRWDLATSDANIAPQVVFQDFACALGVTLDAASAPVLSNLLLRVSADSREVIDPPKDLYARRRPFLDQPGDICLEKSDLLASTASYPSGHATLSWAWGLILSELAPDRATEILSRARIYGESRVVCGVHYPSDIEAGRTNGSALVAALHSSSEFRADMEKARAEIAAVRKTGGGVKSAPGQCKVEHDAESHRPW